MRVGDQVRVVGTPPGLKDDKELLTRSLFEKCLGRVFEVAGIENLEGLDFPLVRLDVGHVIDTEPWEHTIWIEPEYVEFLDDNLSPQK
jgi:hypothetical protein